MICCFVTEPTDFDFSAAALRALYNHTSRTKVLCKLLDLLTVSKQVHAESLPIWIARYVWPIKRSLGRS